MPDVDVNSMHKSQGAMDSLSVYAMALKEKAGLQLLTEEDLLILALNEIAHTFTRDERNYR